VPIKQKVGLFDGGKINAKASEPGSLGGFRLGLCPPGWLYSLLNALFVIRSESNKLPALIGAHPPIRLAG